MFGYKGVLQSVLIAAFGTLMSSLAAPAADQPIQQKTFDASVERVYAAEVQSVGSTLKNAVKEACLVNFRTSTGYYVESWTATCRDTGNGKVSVTLAVQGDWFPGVGGYRKKMGNTFWANVDSALRETRPSNSAPMPPEGAQTNSENLATVQISSEPSGADITLDGDYAGSTPSQLRLKAGAHSVKITKKGFGSWQQSIKVEAGESRNISAELEKSS
jgi:hypothetical protein